MRQAQRAQRIAQDRAIQRTQQANRQRQAERVRAVEALKRQERSREYERTSRTSAPRVEPIADYEVRNYGASAQEELRRSREREDRRRRESELRERLDRERRLAEDNRRRLDAINRISSERTAQNLRAIERQRCNTARESECGGPNPFRRQRPESAASLVWTNRG